ncbi:hypothetical protein NT06LI_1735, partial [Listeria innocua FSL J1-023]
MIAPRTMERKKIIYPISKPKKELKIISILMSPNPIPFRNKIKNS